MRGKHIDKYGTCEFCNKKAHLTTLCKCETVSYCDMNCLNKDSKLHKTACAEALEELKENKIRENKQTIEYRKESLDAMVKLLDFESVKE